MNPDAFPAHRLLREPQLLFDPERRESDVHPLRGLVRFGPFSTALLGPVLREIRVGAVVPSGDESVVGNLIGELARAHRPRERMQYLPRFPGIRAVFGVDVRFSAVLPLPPGVDAEVRSADRPHLALANRLGEAVSALAARRTEFDVLVLYLPTRWERGFYGGPGEDFDLHDFLKAVTASQGIPSQVLLQSKAIEYPCRCSVAWRLGIALYVKSGGVPWKIADASPETAFVGLSYALRGNGEEPRFVTCCSQVFDADGAGLEFIAYEMDRGDVAFRGENPYLSRDQMRAVMARSLALYQQRHGGRVPRRVVVHKTTEFRPAEREGSFDAWGAVDRVDLIQIQQDTPWRSLKMVENPQTHRGRADRWPVERGTMLHLGGQDVLLWTQGDAPSAAEGGHFFKEGRGIPRPLLLRRFAGDGPADEFSRDVLALTKMNWNNDALYDLLPTTLEYASTLARVIRRMPQLAPRPYPFRLFM